MESKLLIKKRLIESFRVYIQVHTGVVHYEDYIMGLSEDDSLEALLAVPPGLCVVCVDKGNVIEAETGSAPPGIYSAACGL